jgi:hypothetical protein
MALSGTVIVNAEPLKELSFIDLHTASARVKVQCLATHGPAIEVHHQAIRIGGNGQVLAPRPQLELLAGFHELSADIAGNLRFRRASRDMKEQNWLSLVCAR